MAGPVPLACLTGEGSGAPTATPTPLLNLNQPGSELGGTGALVASPWVRAKSRSGSGLRLGAGLGLGSGVFLLRAQGSEPDCSSLRSRPDRDSKFVGIHPGQGWGQGRGSPVRLRARAAPRERGCPHPDSRIMQSGGSFMQGFNCQAAVDEGGTTAAEPRTRQQPTRDTGAPRHPRPASSWARMSTSPLGADGPGTRTM